MTASGWKRRPFTQQCFGFWPPLMEWAITPLLVMFFPFSVNLSYPSVRYLCVQTGGKIVKPPNYKIGDSLLQREIIIDWSRLDGYIFFLLPLAQYFLSGTPSPCAHRHSLLRACAYCSNWTSNICVNHVCCNCGVWSMINLMSLSFGNEIWLC